MFGISSEVGESQDEQRANHLYKTTTTNLVQLKKRISYAFAQKYARKVPVMKSINQPLPF